MDFVKTKFVNVDVFLIIPELDASFFTCGVFVLKNCTHTNPVLAVFVKVFSVFGVYLP